MSPRQRFEEDLRSALLAGWRYDADAVDRALNAAADASVGDLRAGPGHLDFRALFDLAREYAVHDRAVLAVEPRGQDREMAAFRGAGETVGSALADAGKRLGAAGREPVASARSALTEQCLRAGREPAERAAMLAWLAGFHAALADAGA